MPEKINKKPYGSNGYISFEKLFTVLKKKGLNKQYLRDNGIHSNTVLKLANNENVTCEVICNLCALLNVKASQIMEYKQPADQQPEQDSFPMNPPEEEQPDQKDIELPDCFK